MKELKKIKSTFFSRQISFAKLAIKTGSTFYKNKDQDLKTQLKNSIEKHALDIVDELDVMKGSFMKAGQMLSLLGGSFLPDEAHKVLKALENKTSFLTWDEIKKQIPKEWLDRIEVAPIPLAAASLGQVHMMTHESQNYAMKIQYRGVAKATKNDIKALKFLLKTLNLIPSELDLSDIFKEIELMLNKEVNYLEEVKSTESFSHNLKDFPFFKVPLINHEFSNERIVTSEFIKGHSLHEIDNLNLTQEQRNTLGREFMRLLFLEIFVFEEIQTDSHFGNYILITEPKLQWGLIDFGATKLPPTDFMKGYRALMLALSQKDRESFISSLMTMGYLSEDKDSDLDLFWEYANIIGAPFYEDEYDWGNSDISNKIYEYIPSIMKSVSIGNPPAHSFYIDKKIAGVYFILQKLNAKFNVNQVLQEVLEYRDS